MQAGSTNGANDYHNNHIDSDEESPPPSSPDTAQTDDESDSEKSGDELEQDIEGEGREEQDGARNGHDLFGLDHVDSDEEEEVSRKKKTKRKLKEPEQDRVRLYQPRSSPHWAIAFYYLLVGTELPFLPLYGVPYFVTKKRSWW